MGQRLIDALREATPVVIDFESGEVRLLSDPVESGP